MEEKTRHELLKSIYEQHWLHARHVENERLWFTNIFALIVAGLLAFLATTNNGVLSESARYAGYFILILSIVGYVFCLTLRAPFVAHTEKAKKLLEDSRLLEYDPYQPEEIYRIIKIGWLSTHELFLYFYALMAGGALYLVLFVGESTKPYWWVSVILAFVLCVLWRGLRVFWDVLKAPYRGLRVLCKTRCRVLWRGLKGREGEYRKKMGVGK